MEKASEEFGDPARAVEPMMIMINVMIVILIMMTVSYRRYVTSNEAREEDPE
jgi:putative effector of murein hydrolase